MLQLLAAALLVSADQSMSPAHSAGTKTATNALAVTYVDCPRNGGVNVSLRITARNLDTLRIAYQGETLPSTADVKDDVIYLRAGAYEILVSSGDCSQSAVVQVLGGRTQVTLIGALGVVMFGARTSIAGTLPVGGVVVYLVYKTLHCDRDCSPDGFLQIPAVVYNRSYYAGEIPVGDASVRLYDVTRSRWLDSPTVHIGSNRHDRNIIYNIGMCFIERKCAP